MVSNDLIARMRFLGFNSYEAKVYVKMLTQPQPLTAYEIAGISGVPRSKVYEVVDRLYKKQTLVQTEENPKRYLAVDPTDVLNSLKAGFDASLTLVRDELSQVNVGETADYILNLIGKDSIIEKSKEMIRCASESILIALDPNMLRELEGDIAAAVNRAGNRKVSINIVYYGEDTIQFDDVHYHKLNQPDIENWLSILLDVDFEQVLAGTMQRSSNEGHGVWTRNVYINNILQDNIIHEIYLGMLEKKFGFDHIRTVTGELPEVLWSKAMGKFRDKFKL
jgi:sugar-specific transcriptional regulator TrmB